MHICYSSHHFIHNKPAAFEPRFARDWFGVTDSLANLRDRILQGDAFIAAAMSSHKRTTAAFVSADLAVVDVDYGLTTEQLLEHPLEACACFAYTTPSHDPGSGKYRFRVLFRLPERITDPALYKAIVTILTRALGGDEACKDPCRIWYGNSAGEQLIWAPDVRLPGEFIDDAHILAEKSKVLYDPDAPDADANSVARAIFVLEQVIDPTRDGERDKFLRISAAAKAGGAEVFPAWSDWASRGHHGSGTKSRQSSERWFNGLNGSSLGTLFWFASQDDPDWRSKLPDELRADSSSYTPGRSATYAGYSRQDFMGDPDEVLSKEPVYGLFDPEQPWAKVAKPAEPVHAGHTDADFMGEPGDIPAPKGSPLCESSLPLEDFGPSSEQEQDQHPGYKDSDFMGYDDTPDTASPGQKTARLGRKKQSNHHNQTEEVLCDILQTYPGLRMNELTKKLEYGDEDKPSIITDPREAYVYVNRRTKKNHPKELVSDILKVQANQSSYNPVVSYLQHCAKTATPPCTYFDRLASELLGVPEHPTENPRLRNGQLLMDVVVQRFLIGAVARALQPGCPMDWMPILVGPQGAGKTRFLQCLTPPGPNGPHPWAASVQQAITTLSERPHKLHCGWIVILDETDRHFGRDHAEIFKNLVSVSVDISDRKWELEQDFERNFVLAGATNSDAFLSDSTGNRRFVPIRVGGISPEEGKQQRCLIDLDRLERDRDSIWAAAYRCYTDHKDDDHPPQLFTQEEAELLKDYTESFVDAPPYVGLIERHVLRGNCGKVEDGKKIITLDEVMDAIELPRSQFHNCKRLVSDALKTLGFVNERVPVPGKKRLRSWVCKIPSSTDTDTMPTHWPEPRASRSPMGGRA